MFRIPTSQALMHIFLPAVVIAASYLIDFSPLGSFINLAILHVALALFQKYRQGFGGTLFLVFLGWAISWAAFWFIFLAAFFYIGGMSLVPKTLFATLIGILLICALGFTSYLLYEENEDDEEEDIHLPFPN